MQDSAELYRRTVNIDSVPKKNRVPDKMRGFVGTRPKIANMLTYFFVDAGLIQKGSVKTSSPFDFHNGRIFISTGALLLEGDGPFRFEDVTDIGSAAVEKYGVDNDVSMEDMSDAFWLLSTELCRRAPGNKTLDRPRKQNRRKGKRHQLDYKPQKRKKYEVKFAEPDWASPVEVRQHELTCGRCPLGTSGLCTLNVASGFYYESGRFVARPRTEPVPSLFDKGALGYQLGKEAPPLEPKKEKTQYLAVLPGLDIGVQRIKYR